MKNSKLFKTITIAAAVTVFSVGGFFAVKNAGTVNSYDDNAKNNVAASVNNNEYYDVASNVTEATEAETEATTEAVAQTEATTEAVAQTEVQTEATTQAEAQTEAQTEAATQAQVSAPSQDDVYSAKAKVNTNTYSSYINQVYALINQERAAAGVKAVALDNDLNVMACHRAVEQADNNWWEISGGHHIRPNGKQASSICYYYGEYGYFGENMGRFYATPQDIMAGWHNSPAHYQCMISGDYNRVGVGVAQDSEGYYYWVAIFMD
ncbi:MAG: CAP domain-containing protein [Lachnospira sp.]